MNALLERQCHGDYTMNDLIVIDKIQPLALFTEGDQLDHILQEIKGKALAHEVNLSTAKSRKEIASIAYKVSQSKTLLDNAGKDLVKDWKAKAKNVDASRKKTRDFLDALRDEVRKPLTDWEEAEDKRISYEKAEEEYNQAWDDAIKEHELFLRQKAIEEKEAQLAKEKAAREVEDKRIADEKESEARDERLKQEAAAKATKESEEKAEHERQEAARKLQEEKDARERAEREKVAAEERAKIEKEMAVKKAKEDAERKAREEKEAAERVEAERVAKEKKKAANKEHQRKVNNAVLGALVKNGISEAIAKEVVTVVASGKIPEMVIKY